MSSQVASKGLKEAIVHSVEYGTYPESEEISSAELPSSVFPDLLTDLQKARDEVKTDIRDLSREVAPDVDSWIAQAKKLQADIKRSKATARDIVQQAEAGHKLRVKAKEFADKAVLLEKEVSFNQTLVETLAQIKRINGTLNDCQDAMVRGDIPSALATLKQADAVLPVLAAVENTRAYDLLQKRSRDLKASLAEQTTKMARSLIHVNVEESRLTVHKKSSGKFEPTTSRYNPLILADDAVSIEALADTLTFLGAGDAYMKRLKRDLDGALFQPLIRPQTGTPHAIRIEDNTIFAINDNVDFSIVRTLDDTWFTIGFLSTHLPADVCLPLSDLLLPSLIDDLTEKRLDACVPVNIDDMPQFQQVLDRVSKLAEQIDGLHWLATTSPLREWVQSAPKTWLAKRRETALGTVRSILFTKLRERNVVERVETQMVSKGDALISGDQDPADDAWDAAWDEEEATEPPVTTKTSSREQSAEGDEDDASAWDVDDDESVVVSNIDSRLTQEKAALPLDENDADVDADADAWGWGDEDPSIEGSTKAASLPGSPQTKRSKASGPLTQREITLKETYTITAVPDGILGIIKQSVTDAETLMDSSYAHTPIGPAASALFTLPTFALAMYRATAPTAYGKIDSGNMLIYNDSTRLADQLRFFLAQQAEKDESSLAAAHQRPISRLKLENDITALDSFARRAYSTEMESQRTILNDMLDGAQGFVNCTVEPFASACESAIDIIAARLRDVHRQWDPILSRSALLQSMGSLLGTATSKVIIDIEDMSDIGEEESKKLRSICDKLSEVRELFLQERPGGGEQGDMTGIYCPNWFKFQYLAEILESSLADIKYLWTEGELRLEFDGDEVVDLIQALFADSDYRRKAIADIRRTR